MIFYKKSLSVPSKSRKIYSFSYFKEGLGGERFLINGKKSAISYNVNYNNNVLKTGLGVNRLQAPMYPRDERLSEELEDPAGGEVLAMWIYERFMPGSGNNKFFRHLVVYCADKKLYNYLLYFYPPTFIQVSSIELEEKPVVIDTTTSSHGRALIFSTEAGVYLFTHSTYHKIDTALNIVAMTIYADRLFAIPRGEQRSLTYSPAKTELDWEEEINNGITIRLDHERGNAEKLINFKGTLYVFREFGISAITEKDGVFNIKHLFVSKSKIYMDTVCPCGDKIFMLLKDGLYSFNGTTAQKIELPINKYIEGKLNYKSCATANNAKYYLACNMEFDETDAGPHNLQTFKNNCLLELDTNTMQINLMRGVEVTLLCNLNDDEVSRVIAGTRLSDGEIHLCEVDHSGGIADVSTEKKWCSAFSDLGYAGVDKVVRGLTVYSKTDVEITIISDVASTKLTVKGKDKMQKIKTALKGKVFALDIFSNQKEIEVSGLSLSFDISTNHNRY